MPEVVPLNPIAASLIEEVNNSAPVIDTIDDIIEKAFIPQGIEIPRPDPVFELDGIPLFTKKSISTLIGKAKSGKTTCLAWITSNIINMGLKVLWFDTEQGLYYASRTQHWVLSLSGRVEYADLMFYELKIHNPKIRIEVVERLIAETQPDIVIIDGIRDLVFDINEASEATLICGHLMRWAETHDCHIVNILHQNKGNEHARGHLGSEMVNKSETVIKVSQDEQKITVCEPEFTRGEPFPIFAFDRDANGKPVLVNYKPKVSSGESNNKRLLPIDVPPKQHLECLAMAFGSNITLTYADLVSNISASFEYFGSEMGVSKTKKFIAFYNQNGYLELAEKKGTKTLYKLKQKVNNVMLTPDESDEDAPF